MQAWSSLFRIASGDEFESGAVLVGLDERRVILDGVRVEEDKIGGIAFATTAIVQRKLLGREVGHFADGVFQGEHVARPDELGQHLCMANCQIGLNTVFLRC